MEQGKVKIDLLKLILDDINKNNKNEEVIQNPEIGVDCGVLDFGNEYVLVSADPITGATSNVGELVVDINANDIYSANGVPVGIVLTILLPVSSTDDDLKKIMSDINNKCKKMNISIIGGHTEVTDAVIRPVISATILGKTENRKLLQKQNIELGYDIVLTKNVALEGTNILACDYEDYLKKYLSNEELEKAKNLSQFLSIKNDSETAFNHSEKIYLHDVTEGGVFGGLYEMFEDSSFGFKIDVTKIPILNITQKICNIFNINPYKLISSGSLLIACEDGEKLVKDLENKNIIANVIGKVIDDKKKILKYSEDDIREIEMPNGDDLFKICLNKGDSNA